MSPEYRNIYQISRMSAGITQEKAAELTGTSVESIRAYEQGQRVPPNHVALRMIEVFNAPHLALQHVRHSSEVARSFIPEIELKELPSAILKLQKEVNDFLRCRDDLLEITCDGVICDSERPRWDEILKELDDISAAILSVKFAR